MRVTYFQRLGKDGVACGIKCAQAPAALITRGGCRPQRPWGSSSLPPYQKSGEGWESKGTSQAQCAPGESNIQGTQYDIKAQQVQRGREAATRSGELEK